VPWARTGCCRPGARTIEGGPLGAPLADAKLHKIASGDFAPEFPLEWALKDVDLAIAAAEGTRLPMLDAVSRHWHAAVKAGYGRDDVSAARLALGDAAPVEGLPMELIQRGRPAWPIIG